MTNSGGLSQAANGLLMQLVMDLKSGYLRRCESLGIKREEMQMLQGLSLEELHYLANSEVSVVSVSIDHSNLVSMLQRARMEQKRMQRIDRALALGSSIELMQTFSGFPVQMWRPVAGSPVSKPDPDVAIRSGMKTMRKSGGCGRNQALKKWKARTGLTS